MCGYNIVLVRFYWQRFLTLLGLQVLCTQFKLMNSTCCMFFLDKYNVIYFKYHDLAVVIPDAIQLDYNTFTLISLLANFAKSKKP